MVFVSQVDIKENKPAIKVKIRYWRLISNSISNRLNIIHIRNNASALVDILFPTHSGNTHYVFLLVPGLIAQLLYYSVSAILNAWKNFTSLLMSGIVGVFSTITIIALTGSMHLFNLTIMVYIKNISYLLPTLFGAIYIYKNRNKFKTKNG